MSTLYSEHTVQCAHCTSIALPRPPGAPPEPPRAAPEPPKALPKLLQTLPQALPGPPRAMPRFGEVQGRSGLVLTVKTRGFRTILELVTGAAGAGEVESGAAGRRPPSHAPWPG